jgi:hypothetical protein
MGITTAVLGALIACVPNFILTVCPFCQNMMMKCVWAAKVEFGIGVLILFLAVMLAFVESKEIRIGVSTALCFVGILAVMVAKVILGFCDGSCNQECTCSSLTAPLMTTMGILVAVISIVNVIYLSRSKNT